MLPAVEGFGRKTTFPNDVAAAAKRSMKSLTAWTGSGPVNTTDKLTAGGQADQPKRPTLPHKALSPFSGLPQTVPKPLSTVIQIVPSSANTISLIGCDIKAGTKQNSNHQVANPMTRTNKITKRVYKQIHT